MGGNKQKEDSYLQWTVKFIQHQTHRTSQVADIGGLLIQGILKSLKVLHPFQCKTVVNYVSLEEERKYSELILALDC